jgi:hypothetical protein
MQTPKESRGHAAPKEMGQPLPHDPRQGGRKLKASNKKFEGPIFVDVKIKGRSQTGSISKSIKQILDGQDTPRIFTATLQAETGDSGRRHKQLHTAMQARLMVTGAKLQVV